MNKRLKFPIYDAPFGILLMNSLCAHCLFCAKCTYGELKKKTQAPQTHIPTLNLMLSYKSFEISYLS